MNAHQTGDLARYHAFLHGFKRIHNQRVTINFVRMYEKTVKGSEITLLQADSYGEFVARVVNASYYIPGLMVQKLSKAGYFMSVIINQCGTQIKYESFMRYADSEVLTNVLADMDKNVRESERCQWIFDRYCAAHRARFATNFFLESLI